MMRVEHCKHVFKCTICAIVCVALCQCTHDEREKKIQIFWNDFQLDISNKNIEFIKDTYFTDKGWESYSVNFDNETEYKNFANFISQQEIDKIIKKEDNLYLLKMNNQLISGSGIGIELICLEDNIKIDRYLPGK